MTGRKPTIRAIINADDFGMSRTTNEAIARLVGAGRVSSVTLLANGPAFDEAVGLCRDWDEVPVGVHLNIMEFAPVTDTPGLAPLLDSSGGFRSNAWTVKIDQQTRKAIGHEWLAQIEKIRGAGIEPSHLDSHFHVHTRPEIFGCLRQTVKESGIDRVRVTKNLYSRSRPVASKVLRIKKGLWNTALRHTIGARTTDVFTEFDTFVEIALDESPVAKTVELMVHPGSEEYAAETKLLESDWQKTLQCDVQLISYRSL